MFSNKLRTLLAFMLVLLLACSFTVFANAETSTTSSVSAASDASDATSATSADNASTASAAGTSSDSATSTASTVSTESAAAATSTESTASTAETGTKYPWLGWAIIGAILLLLAVGIFVSVKRNTPLGQKIAKWFKDYKSEIKKIVWLSRKETLRQTTIVIVIIIVSCAVLGGLDWIFTKLVQLI